MKDKQVKYMNSLALQNWHSEDVGNTYQSKLMLRLQQQLNRCNARITLKNGLEVSTPCRKAMCPVCSRNNSLLQHANFLKHNPTLEKKNCRFMTVVLSLTCNIEQVYSVFEAFRSKTRNEINKRCDRKDVTYSLWKKVSLSGSLEIDSIMSEDWSSLGTKKKHQYETMLGYVPPEGRNVPIYIVTGHFIVYKGRLSLRLIEEIIEKQGVVVHFEKLHENQDISTSVQKTLGYAAKVFYKTSLDGNVQKLWNLEQIQALSGLISRSRGRCSWNFVIKPKKKKQEKYCIIKREKLKSWS